MRKMRARKAKGRQAHLGACTMPRVTQRSILPGGGGANITVLATRASSSESKEVWFGCQRYRR